MSIMASFIDINQSALWTLLAEQKDCIVLTVNSRLPRILKADYHAHCAATQKQMVSRTPTILPWTQWLAQLPSTWVVAGELNPDILHTHTLSPAEETLLWQTQLANQTDITLLQPRLAASDAQKAAQLLAVWQPKIEEAEYTSEYTQLSNWIEQIEEHCREHNWQTSSQRAWNIIEWITQQAVSLPTCIVLSGFEDHTPLQLALWQALQSRQVKIYRWQGNDRPATSYALQRYPTPHLEQQACADWAALQTQQHPDWKIGIIVPDIQNLQGSLRQCFDLRLHGDMTLAWLADQPRAYNLSLGTALQEENLSRIALILLALACGQRSISFSDISLLLLTRYWGDNLQHSSQQARQQAEQALRKHAVPEQSAQNWLRALQQHWEKKPLPDAMQVYWQALLVWQAQYQNQNLTLQAWGQAFAELLNQCGWGGKHTLESREHQTIEHWQAILVELSSLQRIQNAAMKSHAALKQLQYLLSNTLFQPKTKNEPAIQILGPLEAVGMQFDATWLLGATDNILPSAARPHALIPAAAQRRSNMPHANAERELQYAKGWLTRLQHSCDIFIASAAELDQETPLAPSPLLADLPRNLVTAPPAVTYAKLESLSDQQGEPLTASEKNQLQKGGTSLLKHQALCPQWAFVAHRLQVKALETPTTHHDASEQGNSLHKTLQILWQDWENQARFLADLAANRVTEKVRRAAQTALEDYTLPAGVRHLESIRIEKLLLRWLTEVEAQRAPFSVERCESTLLLKIGELKLKGTLDRLDQLNNGQYLIIDYKSSGNLNIKDWTGTPPSEPQLPLYATHYIDTADSSALAAMTYAQLHPQKCQFVGISAEDNLLPKVSAYDAVKQQGKNLFNKENFPTWQSVLNHWQSCLTQLANDFSAGNAALTFKKDSDLNYCDLKPLLRWTDYVEQLAAAGQTLEPEETEEAKESEAV